MKIPKQGYITEFFSSIDENGNGKIDKNEVNIFLSKNNNKKVKQEYNLQEGMDIKTFAQSNMDWARRYVQLTDREYEEGRELLEGDEFVRTNEKRNICEDDQNSTIVEQGRYSIKTYSEDIQTMQTYSLCDCVGVVIYDKADKRAFMTHLDSSKGAENLDKILTDAKFNSETSEVHIIGGMTGRSEGILEIVDETMQKQNLKVIERDILGDENTVRNIQIDLNTGEVFDYDEINYEFDTKGDPKFGLSINDLSPDALSKLNEYGL